MNREIVLYTLGSVLAVSGISVIGIFTLALNKTFLNKVLLLLVSYAAGTLLGDVFIHMLPEMIEDGTLDGGKLSYLFLIGVLAFFVLEKIIHWRHCHILDENEDHAHPLAIVNLAGDAMHNFIDGVIIAASYILSVPVGIATSIAVLFHEIPQEIGDFGVLLHGGFTRKKALFFNFLSALTALIGALVVLVIGTRISNAAVYLVPLAAGGFVYIACADLFPELHKESETGESLLQLSFLTLGIGTMILLLRLEHIFS